MAILSIFIERYAPVSSPDLSALSLVCITDMTNTVAFSSKSKSFVCTVLNNDYFNTYYITDILRANGVLINSVVYSNLHTGQ